MSENIDNEQEELEVSSIDDFKKVADVAKKLLDQRNIKVKITSSLRFSLTVDETALEEELKSSEINSETFKRILESEIAIMLFVVLSETEKEYLDFVLRNVEVKDDEKETIRKLTEDKLDIVKKIIIGEEIEGIRARYLITATSKQDFFDDISWEINEKQYTSERDLKSLRYATFRLRFKRNPVLLSGFPTIMLSNEDTYSAAFDCDVTQIDDLISVLENAKKKLQHKDEKNEP